MTRSSISGVFIADSRICDSGTEVWSPAGQASEDGCVEPAAVGALFDEWIIVAADPSAHLSFDALIVGDHYHPAGLLSGIQAGLFAARHPNIFLTAADNGAVSPAVIDLFAKALEPRWDAVLIESDTGVLPLPGIYGKRALKPIEQQLANAESRFDQLIPRLRIRKLPIDVVMALS